MLRTISITILPLHFRHIPFITHDLHLPPHPAPAAADAGPGPCCPLAHAQEVIVAAESAESTASSKDSATLQAVHVTAVRSEGFKPVTVKAGTFRGADVMDVPSTINVVTSKVLEAQAAEGLYDAVRNTAGVTRQQNGGDTWDQLVIRGVEVQNRTNYRLNGSMPIMNFSQVPMENKARVEVLKGASALYYGFTAPSGIVNYVTKRAGLHPVTSVGLRFDTNGTLLAHADVGRRFGDEDQYAAPERGRRPAGQLPGWRERRQPQLRLGRLRLARDQPSGAGTGSGVRPPPHRRAGRGGPAHRRQRHHHPAPRCRSEETRGP